MTIASTISGGASIFQDCPGGSMEYRWSGPGVTDTWTSDPTAPATLPAAASADYTLEVQRQGDPGCFDTDLITATIDTGEPTGSIANALRVSLPAGSTDLVLDWTAGPLTPDQYSVHRSDDPAALQLPNVLPATEEETLNGQGETYGGPWSLEPPPSGTGIDVLFYRVFGMNVCTGEYVSP